MHNGRNSPRFRRWRQTLRVKRASRMPKAGLSGSSVVCALFSFSVDRNYLEAGWPVLKSRASRHNVEVVNSAMAGLKFIDLPELWLPIETGSR
jgi:hypothetical protein